VTLNMQDNPSKREGLAAVASSVWFGVLSLFVRSAPSPAEAAASAVWLTNGANRPAAKAGCTAFMVGCPVPPNL